MADFGYRAVLPSLKQTFSHPKMDGWKTILSFWDTIFSGVMLVSGYVNLSSRVLFQESVDTQKGLRLAMHLHARSQQLSEIIAMSIKIHGCIENKIQVT